MIQQINLYQKAVRPVKVILPASHMALLGALTCLVLAAYAMVLSSHVAELEKDVGRIQQDAGDVEARFTALEQKASAATEDPALLKRVESLQRARDARIPLLEIFRERKKAATPGFSPALEALARQDIEDLWLRRIIVGNSREPMLVLEGSSLDPRLLPQYLKGLSVEESLSGFEFIGFTLTRAEEGKGERVDFAMQTKQRAE